MNSLSNTRKGILFAFIAMLLWGFLPIIIKIVLKTISPVAVTWFRFFSASIMLVVFYLIKKPSALKIIIKPPLLLLLAALCLGLNYLGFIEGLHYTTPAIAEIFIQTGGILLAISGFVFFHEKVSPRHLLGIILVFGGMGVFYHDQILVLAENVSKYKTGVLLTIGGGIMWVCYAIIQKGLVRKFDPMTLNLVLFILPAIGFSSFVNYHEFSNISTGTWLILIFLGINTVIAYGSLAYALKYLDANKVSVIITANPIITFSALALLIVFDIRWIDHEKFTWISIVGALTVIVGITLTVMKKKNRKTK